MGLHLFPRSSKGITLLELMLIIFLIGILSALTVPSLLRFNERWLLRSTAYMIANDIRRVQRMSVQECAYYNFELQTRQFYYILRHKDPTDPNIKKVTLDPRIVSISSTLHDSGYGGAMEGLRILTFSPMGSPNKAGEIVLKTVSGYSIRLTVDVTTGRVLVYD